MSERAPHRLLPFLAAGSQNKKTTKHSQPTCKSRMRGSRRDLAKPLNVTCADALQIQLVGHLEPYKSHPDFPARSQSTSPPFSTSTSISTIHSTTIMNTIMARLCESYMMLLLIWWLVLDYHYYYYWVIVTIIGLFLLLFIITVSGLFLESCSRHPDLNSFSALLWQASLSTIAPFSMRILRQLWCPRKAACIAAWQNL